MKKMIKKSFVRKIDTLPFPIEKLEKYLSKDLYKKSLPLICSIYPKDDINNLHSLLVKPVGPSFLLNGIKILNKDEIIIDIEYDEKSILKEEIEKGKYTFGFVYLKNEEDDEELGFLKMEYNHVVKGIWELYTK